MASISSTAHSHIPYGYIIISVHNLQCAFQTTSSSMVASTFSFRLPRQRCVPCGAAPSNVSQGASKGVWLDQRIERSKRKAADSQDLLLDGLKVVLVSPKHAANVGAVARVCDNFECASLHVVDPRCDVLSDEVLKLACGSSLVDNICVHDTLQEAVADVKVAVAFTRRAGTARRLFNSWAHLNASLPPALAVTPRNLSLQRNDASTQGCAHGALVFGREESGLSAEEVFENLQAGASSSVGTQPATHPADEVASVQDIQALVQRWARIAEACGDSSESFKGGSGNHSRKLTSVGQFMAVLAQGPTTVAQVKGMHALAKSIERNLKL